VAASRLTLTNPRPIPVNLDRYPTSDRVSFVVFFAEPLRDAFGNALHPVAFTWDAQGVGTGGGTGPALPPLTPPSASTAAGARAAAVPPGGGGGGGGCSLEGADGGRATGGALALLALALALVAARRQRVVP